MNVGSTCHHAVVTITVQDDMLEGLAVQLNTIAAVIRNEQRTERSARP